MSLARAEAYRAEPFEIRAEDPIVRRQALVIEQLQAENNDLASYAAALKAALVASNVELPELRPAWSRGLTQQEAALMGALIRAYPRPMRSQDLIAVLPHHDHAKDHNLKLVVVLACRVRKVLGRGAIETFHGVGYRASPRFMVDAQPRRARLGDESLRL